MPFRSENQRRYLWSQHPDIAEAWAHGRHTTKGSNHKMPSGQKGGGKMARRKGGRHHKRK